MSSTSYANPLDIPVTEPQRDRSADYLQRAYAEGRIGPEEFEDRIGQVLQARTRRELNRAFDGLARIPVTSALSPFQRPAPGTPTAPGRALAAVAHLSALGTWAVGPAIAYGLAPQGSYLRRQAARAFNFQVLTALLMTAVVVLLGGNAEGMGALAVSVGWLVFTLAGAARAASGEDWRNPVSRAVPLRLLDEGPRARRTRAALGR